MHEDMTKPSHYRRGEVEVIDICETYSLNFSEGNVVKYVCRSKYKGDRILDLLKAKYYIERLIKECEKNDSANKRE